MNRQKNIRVLRRTAVTAMAGVMLLSQPALAQISPEFARSAAEWERLRDNRLEWDEIPDLVHEYNATVTSNWIQYQHDEAKGLTSDEYADKLRQQAEEAYDEAISGDTVNDATIAAAEMQRRQMLANADAATIDGEVVKMSYEQAEAGVVLQVQSNLVSYYTAQLTRQMDQLTATHQQSLYDMAVRKKTVGQATELEVLTEEETLKQAQAALITDEAAVEQARRRVLIDLGWKYSDTPELCALPEVSDEMLAAMNLEQDTLLAEENNYSLRINERKIANAQEDSTKRQLENTVSTGREQLKADIRTKYQTVMDAKTKCSQQALNVSNLANTLQVTSRNYELGSASARELETAQYQYDQAQLTAQMNAYSLTQTYLTYQAAVKGLASTGN